MFVVMARSLPLSGSSEKFFTRTGSGLTQKLSTILEKPVRKKHSSLLGPFVSYGENK